MPSPRDYRIVNRLHGFGECRSFVVDRDDVVLRFGRRSSEPPSSWARYVKTRAADAAESPRTLLSEF
ncbi:hypothetical protein ACSQ67_020319 [Phaseolus vulgaris]